MRMVDTLRIENHQEEIKLPVLTLKSANLFLGYSWLTKHNPSIDWRMGNISFNQCLGSCKHTTSAAEVRSSCYVILQQRVNLWPEYLDEYQDVFSEENFEKLPEHRTWDHVIDLKPGFKPSDCKVYLLSVKE